MAGTIIDFGEKSKGFADKVKPFYPLFLILVIASIFFALGRLSALERAHTPIKIENPANQSDLSQTSAAINSSPRKDLGESMSRTVFDMGSGEVIGSKSGKKYYYPWCGTVKRIKPENQVHFISIEAAKAAGFTAGGNCKGLK